MSRALLLALALGASIHAGAQIAVPPLVARVTDQTGTLTGEQKASLERTLQQFEARKGSQIVVLMVPTTGGEPIEQFALRAAEKWQPGRKKIDDGALLVVAKDDRALRIEVGYGLEGALNDATARRIVSEVIVPRLKEGDFYGGIAAGVDSIIRVVDGEPLPAPAARNATTPGGIEQLLPILLIVAVVAGIALRSMLGQLRGAIAAGAAVGLVAWLMANALAVALIAGVAAFLFTLLGIGGGGFGGMHGGHGRIRGYGGYGRGSFGGGFRGGGGGFGGGGASGRW